MDFEKLMEERAKAVADARSVLDTAEAEKRELSAEEESRYDAFNAEIDRLDGVIERGLSDKEREARTAELEERASAFIRPADDGAAEGRDGGKPSFEQEMRSWLLGENQAKFIELDPADAARHSAIRAEYRDLTVGTASAGGNTVPTGFYNQLIAHLIEVSGIMQTGPTVLRTASGEAIPVPKTTAHGTAALVAEGAAFAEDDPAFGQVTLNAYKYGKLLQISQELVEDTGVDLLGYLAMAAGRAVGNAVGTHLVTGDGSAKPNGVVTAATLGVTGGAGVTGAFTADDLIDLQFSVISPYRNSPSCAWLLRDATLAKVRKLKDTTNQYIWQPSLQVGAPDVLLGKPVYTDPNVAAVGLSAKSVLFGDFSQYFVRQVRAIRFERSTDYAFANDLITYRIAIRMDGDLVDTTGAIKYFAGNAA